MIKNKLAKFTPFFRSAMVVVVSLLFVTSIVYAATTIGTNIITGGTLQAEGSYASTTGYMVVGTGLGDLVPSAGDLVVSGNATTSGYFVIGTTAKTIDMTAGDLLVGNSATITSNFVVQGAYASTTGYLVVGSGLNAVVPSAGDLIVSGNATTSGYFTIGTTEKNLSMAAGDLLVGNNATVTGNLAIGGWASTTGYLKVGGGIFDLSTSSVATTTPGIFSRDRTTSTSTVSIGDISVADKDTPGLIGCLEMVDNAGGYWSCYIDPDEAVGARFICDAGRCNW